MSQTYGVLPSGFVRKGLPQILAEIQAANITTFGPGVIQTPQSPLGQINGLMADILTDAWETLEDTYASFDADQAEDMRLDIIAKLRRLPRPDGETEADFRRRITNQGQADVSLTQMMNQIRAVEGVTWVSVRVNDTDYTDAFGIPGHAIAVAVEGGDDSAVALAINAHSVAGIGLYGNMQADFFDGFQCRVIRFIRPQRVYITAEIIITELLNNQCASPTTGTVKAATAEYFQGRYAPPNGSTVTTELFDAAASKVEGIAVQSVEIARKHDPVGTAPLAFTLFERPMVDAADIVVIYDLP